MEQFDQLPNDVLSDMAGQWLSAAKAEHATMIDHLRIVMRTLPGDIDTVGTDEAPDSWAVLDQSRQLSVDADVYTAIGGLLLVEELRLQPTVFYGDRIVALLAEHYDRDAELGELMSGALPQPHQGQDPERSAESISYGRRKLGDETPWTIRSRPGHPSLVMMKTPDDRTGMFLLSRYEYWLLDRLDVEIIDID